jgi:predicted permease
MSASALRRWAARVWAFLTPGRAEAELDREVAAHLLLLEDEFRRQGLPDEDARRAARRALGGVDQAKERQRDARSFPWLVDLRRDLGHAWRGLVHAPGFAAAAIGTLAIGIGGACAVLTVTYALLVKPLAFAHEPASLVRLMGHSPHPTNPTGPPVRREVGASAAEVEQLLARSRALTGAGIVSPTLRGIAGIDGAGRLSGAHISASALSLLDTGGIIGRIFTAEEERNVRPVVMLSHAAWRRLFGGDATVLGRTLVFESVLGARRSVPLEVIGILPPAFTFPTAQTDFWLPPQAGTNPPFRGRLLARLAPGVTPEAAVAEVGEIVRELRGLGPEVRFELTREQDELVADMRPTLSAMLAATGVLLALACLNVAALFHARALARRREFATRAAVGASRGRLVSQALTESGLVGVLGSGAGVLLAYGALEAFRVLAAPSGRLDLGAPTPFPRLEDVRFDAPIVTTVALAGLAVGLLVGVVAAVHATGADAFASIRQARVTGRGGWRGRRLLVVTQVAGAVVLLVGALLLASTLRNLLSVDTGYARQQRLTFQVTLPSTRYTDAQVATFAEALADRLAAVPSIGRAAYANQVPLVQLRDSGGGLWTTPDATRTAAPDAADQRYVSREYLAAMGITVLRGRGFEASDGTGQPRVLLVNQALVDRQFAGRDPIGLQVYVGRDVAPWTIIGIVANVRQFGLRQAPEPQFFVDLRQWAPGVGPRFPVGPYFVATTQGTTDAAIAAVRDALSSLDEEARLFNVATMDALVASSVARPRLVAAVLLLFAAAGVALAAVGLYGVLAYLVTERRQEFGVRMALGAATGDIMRLVARQGALVVGLGVAIGVVGALGSSRLVESLLFGVTSRDPWAYLLAGLVLSLTAAAAVWTPARRATRVDPVEVLRSE